MTAALPLALSAIFIVLAGWHFFMALAPSSEQGGAVPMAEGKPLFKPSRAATVAVGIVLLGFAALVAATGAVIDLGIAPAPLRWMSAALAAGLLGRAIGEFKYLGFFKRVKGSRFATLDTWVYSPLCLLLAAGVAYNAARTVSPV